MKTFDFDSFKKYFDEHHDKNGPDAFLLNYPWDIETYNKDYIIGFINGWKGVSKAVKMQLIGKLHPEYIRHNAEYVEGFMHGREFSEKLK